MLAMLAMLLIFPVFFAVFCSKVTLPTIASLAMLLRKKGSRMNQSPSGFPAGYFFRFILLPPAFILVP
jgi:hypothetical protein